METNEYLDVHSPDFIKAKNRAFHFLSGMDPGDRVPFGHDQLDANELAKEVGAGTELGNQYVQVYASACAKVDAERQAMIAKLERSPTSYFPESDRSKRSLGITPGRVVAVVVLITIIAIWCWYMWPNIGILVFG